MIITYRQGHIYSGDTTMYIHEVLGRTPSPNLRRPRNAVYSFLCIFPGEFSVGIGSAGNHRAYCVRIAYRCYFSQQRLY